MDSSSCLFERLLRSYANTENVFYCLIISRLLKLGKLDRVQFLGSQVLNRVCNFPI